MRRQHAKKMNKQIIFLFCLILTCSCVKSSHSDVLCEECPVRIIDILPMHESIMFEMGECQIEVVAELSLPNTFKYMGCQKMIYEDGYFYILDEKYNRTIHVFDSLGNYHANVGTRGRAEHEYINAPTDFFVDTQTKTIHVFERDSRRILIFNKDGSFIKSLKFNSWPYSIGYIKPGTYWAAFNYKKAGNDAGLGVFCPEADKIKRAYNLKKDCAFVNKHRTFRKYDGINYHIPNLSDSVLVMKGDTITEIVKLRFNDSFISDHIRNQVAVSDMHEYTSFCGVASISNYYETSGFVTFSYTLSNVKINCLIDKLSGKQYQTTGSFVKGIFPGCSYTVMNDHILWLITEDDIDVLPDELKDRIRNDEIVDDVHPLIKEIIKKRYTLPIVLKLSPVYE